MALADDLRTYFRTYGHVGPPRFGNKRVVIVGEVHNVLAPRYTVSVAVLRQIFRDGRYRFFANESYFNATIVRTAVRDDWKHGVVPPPYNPASHYTSRYEIAKAVVVDAFHPLLNELKTKHVYVLHIGSRVTGHRARDTSIAHHFVDEMNDRGLSTHTHGVMLVGAAHAAAVPFDTGSSVTMRMHLKHKLYHCVSMLLVTDHVDQKGIDDRVIKIGSTESVRLTDIVGEQPMSVATHHPNSPFRHVILEGSDLTNSIASQYEYVMVHKL
jgi:hypothetical protein